MEVAVGALASLLPKLAVLLQDEYKLNLRADVRYLTAELEDVRASLQAMDDVPPEQLDSAETIWARDMRQFCHELENVVDTFLFRLDASATPTNKSSKTWHIMKKPVKLFEDVRNRREVSKTIKGMKRRSDEIRNRFERYKNYTVTRSMPSASIDPRHYAVFAEHVDLVGIDESKKDLWSLMTKDDAMSQLKIICIVGFAGVGKTTLAKAAFDEFEGYFNCSAFVSLGQHPDMMRVYKDILYQFAKVNVDAAPQDGEKEFLQQSKNFLRDKRNLAVVDDIWDLEAWDIIKIPFMGCTEGSILMVTTRRVDIAKNIGCVYRLAPLSQTYSRILFYRGLFDSEDACPPILEDKFEKFIAMCCGIPLAITAYSSFLARVTTNTEMDLQAMHDPFLCENSSPAPELDYMRKILALSYTDLPPHLKNCLLYLSMFPKSYEISGDRLVWGWIAEGFVEETEGTKLQESGERYLSELISRSLIEPEIVDAGGKILSCRVHNLMHGLITSLSSGKNFSTTLNCEGRLNSRGAINRLSICGNEGKYSMPQMNLSHARSFVACGDANLMPSLSDFKQLRVLDLGFCDALQNDHLKGIDKSPLLKYVAIGGNRINRLPNEIVKLKLLQTLDLRASGLNELPEIVVWLTQLKCLYVSSHMKIPDGIGKMQALEEIGDINICKPELLKELFNLDKLSALRIAIWSWNDNLATSQESILGCLRFLKGKKNIRSLSILTCSSLDITDDLGAEWAPGLRNLEVMYSAFLTLPSWIESLHNLSSLSIEFYKLSQHIIDMLGRFPNLHSLSLTIKHASEEQTVITTDGFSTLTGFHFASNAMGLTFAPGAMQRVNQLKLSFQASRTEGVFNGFIIGLKNLYSLEHVRVVINCFNATHLVVKRAEAAIREELSSGRILEIQRVHEEDMINEVIQDGKEQGQHKETNNNAKSSAVGDEVVEFDCGMQGRTLGSSQRRTTRSVTSTREAHYEEQVREAQKRRAEARVDQFTLYMQGYIQQLSASLGPQLTLPMFCPPFILDNAPQGSQSQPPKPFYTYAPHVQVLAQGPDILQPVGATLSSAACTIGMVMSSQSPTKESSDASGSITNEVSNSSS